MRLVWYQRQDSLWNAACACNASVCGVEFERRADAEAAHFDLTIMERASRGTPGSLRGKPDPRMRAEAPRAEPVHPSPVGVPMKVYKVELLIIDHDALGPEEVRVVLENANYPNDCIRPQIASIEDREIEWTDEHPLNQRTWLAAFRAMFGLS